MYHKNAVVDNLVSTVINDGNGDQCGFTYAQRVAIAKRGYAISLLDSIKACRNVAKKYGMSVSPDIIRLAGETIAEYYDDHVAEMGE